MQNKPTYGMTSQEAAALYLSEGRTDDPGLASMLDYAKKQPELLIPKGRVGELAYKPAQLVIDDPDDAERIRLRNLIGFDVEVIIDDDINQATLLDTEYMYKVRTKLTDDPEVNAVKLSKAMIKLQKKHNKRVLEGERDD